MLTTVVFRPKVRSPKTSKAKVGALSYAVSLEHFAYKAPKRKRRVANAAGYPHQTNYMRSVSLQYRRNSSSEEPDSHQNIVMSDSQEEAPVSWFVLFFKLDSWVHNRLVVKIDHRSPKD